MPADINVVSPQNSLNLPGGLNPNQAFTGDFIDVTDYTSVTSMTDNGGTSTVDGFEFQWSQDGVTVSHVQAFNDTSGKSVFSASVKAPYFRIEYTAGGLGHSSTFIQTMLRRGTPAGSIGKAGSDISSAFDAQTTNSVLVAPRLDAPTDLVFPRASGDPFLYVIHPPPRSTFITQSVSATTFFSPQLDFFGLFGGTRRFFTIFNNTIRGNLYINFGGVASVSPFGYNYKIPPQGTWTMPYSWIPYSGTIFGIWDIAIGGEAHVMEAF